MTKCKGCCQVHCQCKDSCVQLCHHEPTAVVYVPTPVHHRAWRTITCVQVPLVALSARRSVPPGSVGARPPPCPHLSTLRSTICSQVTVTIQFSGACSTLQCKVFHCTMFIVQISSICHWAVVAWEVENL